MSQPTRLFALIVVGTSLLACSGDEVPADPGATPVVSVGVDDAAPETSAVVEGTTTTTLPTVERTVSVSVRGDELGLSADLESSAIVDGDPFGDFAACSGLRDTVSAYSVGVGSADSPVQWVSITSAARITGSGIVDADVRVERAIGSPIDAVGTMTIDPGLASGSFVAFDTQGRRLEGSFACVGADAPPAALDADQHGVVEVVALLGQGPADRVVGLASTDPAEVSCPLNRDGEALVVRVDGDQTVGGITSFELATTDDGGYAMRLRVGAVVYEFVDVVVELLDDASGSFSAADGTTTVAGAFTCT